MNVFQSNEPSTTFTVSIPSSNANAATIESSVATVTTDVFQINWFSMRSKSIYLKNINHNCGNTNWKATFMNEGTMVLNMCACVWSSSEVSICVIILWNLINPHEVFSWIVGDPMDKIGLNSWVALLQISGPIWYSNQLLSRYNGWLLRMCLRSDLLQDDECTHWGTWWVWIGLVWGGTGSQKVLECEGNHGL